MIASSCRDAVVLKLWDDARGPGPKGYAFLKHLNAGRMVYIGNAIPSPELQSSTELRFTAGQSVPEQGKFPSAITRSVEAHFTLTLTPAFCLSYN